MDLIGIAKLLTRISINYPVFKKQIIDGDNKIQKIVAEEWERQIGFLSLEEALERLDVYMEDPANTKPPRAIDLRKTTLRSKHVDEWHAPGEHQWHLVFMKWDTRRMHGRLFDQEDREYIHDPVYEDGYHYDTQGRICTIDGRVVH